MNAEYVFIGLSLIIIICGLIFKTRSTFFFRGLFIATIAFLDREIIVYREPLFDLGIHKAFIWIGIIVYVILSAVACTLILKSRFKFGNYFILSLGFLINLIKNKEIERKSGQICLGNIIPYNKKDIGKSGYLLAMPDKMAAGGTIITGSTGSGKTYTIKDLVKQDIRHGNGVLYFDMKGDQEVRDELASYAEKNGYTVYCFDKPGNEFFFDPLSNLSSEGRIEALLSMRKWSLQGADDHYRQNLKLVCQKYVHYFDKYIQDDEDLRNLNQEEFMYTRVFYNFITTNKPDMSNIDIANAYKTLKTLLELLLTGPMKQTLQDNTLQQFSFEEKSKFNDYKWLMIVSIPSENKELANSILNLYIKNMMHVGTHEPFGNWIKMYIDEFGTVTDPFCVKDVLEKGRSMSIATTLSMQDISQVEINSNVAFVDSLLGCVRNFLIFSGATAKAAQRLSGVQIKDIDKILQSLRGPSMDGRDRPTAAFITKNALLERGKASEVYKIFPGNTPKFSELFGEGAFEDDSAGGGLSRSAKDKLFVDMINNDFF